MNIDITLFNAGYCTHKEKIIIKSGKWKTIKIPAIYALMKHPTLGYMLFDTGYSECFFNSTTKFPYNIYKKITPVYFDDNSLSAKEQLIQLGIQPSDVNFIIISHFHADHISGLNDFPNAKFICSKLAYDNIKSLNGIKAVTKAFIPELLPKDFINRVEYIEDKEIICIDNLFEIGFDIFGDKSIVATFLPGHAIGQIGIFLNTRKRQIFLCADATWDSQSFLNKLLPHKIAFIIIPEKRKYVQSINKLHLLSQFNKNIIIIPSHCRYIWKKYIIDKEEEL